MPSLRQLNEEIEANERRYESQKRANATIRSRVKGVGTTLSLFVVRTGSSCATVYHAAGDDPTVEVLGFNIYRTAGVTAFIGGLVMQARTGRGQFITALGEGPLQTTAIFKTLKWRLKDLKGAAQIKRAAETLARLSGDDPGSHTVDVANRLGRGDVRDTYSEVEDGEEEVDFVRGLVEQSS